MSYRIILGSSWVFLCIIFPILLESDTDDSALDLCLLMVNDYFLNFVVDGLHVNLNIFLCIMMHKMYINNCIQQSAKFWVYAQAANYLEVFKEKKENKKKRMSSKQKIKRSYWAEDVKNFYDLLAVGYNQTEIA
jgi:hypothetical protein